MVVVVEVAFETFLWMLLYIILFLEFAGVVGWILSGKRLAGVFVGIFLAGVLAYLIVPDMLGLVP